MMVPLSPTAHAFNIYLYLGITMGFQVASMAGVSIAPVGSLITSLAATAYVTCMLCTYRDVLWP